jgi:hypothetical protein
MSLRIVMVLAAAAALTGCGLAETGAAAAAGGASSVEAAKQAKETEDKVVAEIEAAQAKAAEMRAEAEKMTE